VTIPRLGRQPRGVSTICRELGSDLPRAVLPVAQTAGASRRRGVAHLGVAQEPYCHARGIRPTLQSRLVQSPVLFESEPRSVSGARRLCAD